MLDITQQIESKQKKLANIILNNTDDSCGLFSGGSGEILVLGYLYESTNNRVYLKELTSHLERIFFKLDNGLYQHSFSNGIAGLGWLYEDLIQRKWIDANSNEVLMDVDDLSYEWMMREQAEGNYDFLHGAIGGGLYFLKRLKSDPLQKIKLENHLELLLSQMHYCKGDETNYWITKPNYISTFTESYNFGLSHGIPSILVYLSKCYNSGIFNGKLKPIIQKTSNFIIKYYLKPHKLESCFPTSVSLEGDLNRSSRLAWCYGDLGVCCALWYANQILQDRSLENLILDVLLHNAKIRNSDNSRVIDAGLCHGASGVAHIFKRFYHRYQNILLLDAANYWYDIVISMDDVENEYGGYKKWSSNDSWVVCNSFLEGNAGILASLSWKEYNSEPYWDEVLLIS